MRLVRIDGDLDLGRGRDEVALEVDEVGAVRERVEDRVGRRCDAAPGRRALTMTLRLFEVKPGRLGRRSTS